MLFLGSRKIQGMVWFVDTTPYCIYNYSMHEFDYHRHAENTKKVVKYLVNYPQVEKVNHPSLPAHPNHALYTKYFPNGGASIFTFEIKGGQEEDRRFMDNLKLFSLLANVANVKDFAIHPPPFPTLPGRIAGIGH